jgi:hypothetical protein
LGPSDDKVSICLTLPTIRLLGINPSALRPPVAVWLGSRSKAQQEVARADGPPLDEHACVQMDDIVPGGGCQV